MKKKGKRGKRRGKGESEKGKVAKRKGKGARGKGKGGREKTTKNYKIKDNSIRIALKKTKGGHFKLVFLGHQNAPFNLLKSQNFLCKGGSVPLHRSNFLKSLGGPRKPVK